MSACDHVRDRGARGFDVGETRHDAAGELRPGRELDGHFGRHREHALAADDDRKQIEPRRVERLGPELHGFAVRGEAAHAQHVV